MVRLISPISSRKRVPWSASWKSPFFSRTAPVKAPRSWPKSSLSSRFSGIAPQLTDRKRRAARGLEKWIARAISSFAGAALALDQHGRGGPRDPLDQTEDLAHARAAADDVVEAVALLELAPEVDVLLVEPALLERAVDDDLELVDVEGLRHVVVGAELHRLDRALGGGVGGHHDHRRAGLALADLAQQVETVAVGHHHVAQHEVGRGVGEALARLADRARRRHLEPLAVAEHGEEVDEALLVVDDQHPAGHASAPAVADDTGSSGSSIAMAVPCPAPLSTSTRPPCSSTMR